MSGVDTSREAVSKALAGINVNALNPFWMHVTSWVEARGGLWIEKAKELNSRLSRAFALIHALEAERDTARAEAADLKTSVIAFCAPWAVEHAKAHGLPPGHLHPTHYDILAKAGARMDSFTRAALAEPTP